MDKEQLLLTYFTSELTPEQEQQFHELLTTDTEFKEQFNFEKDLREAIRDKETTGLKSKLIGFEKEITSKTPVRILRPNYQKWAMAASIALLVTLGWIGYNNFSGPNYDNLFEDNFQQYPNTVYAITRSETTESIERDAFVAYESGNFQSAIDNFNKIPAGNKQEYHDFYLGQSYLNLGDLQNSKAYFNKVVSSDSEFIAEAQWYLALISIKEKDNAAAIEHLKELTSKYEFQKDRALGLLEELE